MIPKHMDELIEEEQKRLTQEQQERKVNRILSGSAVGAGIAVALSMFALKHDINKIYFDLSRRIDVIEMRQSAPAGTLYNHPSVTPQVTSQPVHLEVHVHTEGYKLSEACITPKNGVYEVRPC